MLPRLNFLIPIIFLTVCTDFLKAQDTLRLSAAQAEQILLEKNLTVLANRYNIDINKAYETQAKLYDNPIVNTDQNLYDGKLFRHTKDYGQIFIQLQQLIKTAGKREKLIRLVQDQTLSAEAQVNDIIRNLRFLLNNNLNTLQQLQANKELYQREMTDLVRLSAAMDSVLNKGEVSLKENLRVKALLFQLQNNINDIEQQQILARNDIQTLLQLNASVIVVAVPPPPLSINDLKVSDVQQLMDVAVKNRPDIVLAKSQIAFQQHNWVYQKALAVPDVLVGTYYDHRNSYVPHYFGLTASVALPFFNKNQGNIKAAEISIKQAETQTQNVQNQAFVEVATAFQKWQSLQQFRLSTPADLGKKYDDLLSNVNKMYKERQISLLDFIDFFESYRDTQLQKIQVDTRIRNAATELNYTVGQTVVNQE